MKSQTIVIFNYQNSDLLILTYGALVNQVIKNTQSITHANQKLQQMYYNIIRGKNIGYRIIDQFIVKQGKVCRDYKQMAETFAKAGLKMFLGIRAEVENFEVNQNKITTVSFNLKINQNPLLQYVQLPNHLQGLQYQNVICGVIEGALYTLNLVGKVYVIRDSLKHKGQPTIIKIQVQRQIINDDQ